MLKGLKLNKIKIINKGHSKISKIWRGAEDKKFREGVFWKKVKEAEV